MQDAKRSAVRQHFGRVPAYVTFVPADLTEPGWHAALYDRGFEPSTPTLFLWEGVTYYLDALAVDSVLQVIAMVSSLGSYVALDVLSRDVLEGRRNGYGTAEHVAYVGRLENPSALEFPLMTPEAFCVTGGSNFSKKPDPPTSNGFTSAALTAACRGGQSPSRPPRRSSPRSRTNP